MVSKVAICNLALAKLGAEPFITAIDEDSKSARFCNLYFDPMRDALLRAYLWKFARKKVVLAPLVETPPFDEGNYFQLPEDCLRVVGTDQDYMYGYGRWLVEGDKIIADTDTLNLVYTSQVTDTGLFDSIFVDAMASKLAYELAMPLVQSQSLKDQMKTEMRENVMRAAYAGATEQDSYKFIAEAFIYDRASSTVF